MQLSYVTVYSCVVVFKGSCKEVSLRRDLRIACVLVCGTKQTGKKSEKSIKMMTK
jgi:hypothetical protein